MVGVAVVGAGAWGKNHIRVFSEMLNVQLKYVCVGANATIVCGNRIGQYAFIGAGSVVTKDVPDYALVYGSPGRVKG